jgi:hypothetical protein
MSAPGCCKTWDDLRSLNGADDRVHTPSTDEASTPSGILWCAILRFHLTVSPGYIVAGEHDNVSKAEEKFARA